MSVTGNSYKKRIIFIGGLLVAANAYPYRNAFYFHPASLFYSSIHKGFWMNVTYERKLPGNISLIIDPVIYSWDWEIGHDLWYEDPYTSTTKTSRVSNYLGVRKYLFEKYSGLYAQGSLNLEYREIDYENDQGEQYTGEGFIIGPLLYLGAKANFSRFSFYADLGFGRNFSDLELENGTKPSDYAVDLNLGVGLLL
ncbi:hypothetical protein ACFL5V_04580 [Fibrobacterota bacterium]